MPDPYLPRRLQGRGYRSSRYALPVGTPSTALEPNPGGDSGGGLFGTGIGPNVNLGIGTAFKELGQGVTSLAALLTPGSKENEPGFREFNAGLTSSLAGTLITLAKPVTAPIKGLGGPDIESGFEGFIGRALGDGEEEEEAFKARDLWESATERGLLPSLVENVGNVALAGAAVTAPSKAASIAARAGGATETAARFAAINTSLKARPLINAMQHPYRTAGRALRTEVLAPAAAKVEAAGGVLPKAPDADVPDADVQVAGTSPEGADLDVPDPSAVDTPEGAANPMAPPGRGTKFLAAIEQKLVAQDVHRKALEETRLAEMERRTAARSPAVRSAVHVAREHLIEAGKAQGIAVSRKEASLIVGDEIRSRMTGVKALEEEYLARGVPEDVFISTGIRERFVPQPLRTPEMETALAAAVDAQLQAGAEVRSTLMETSGKGLEDVAATEPTLTRGQQKLVAQAAKKLERAHSDVLARKEARELASRERYIAAETDKLGRIAAATRRVDELAGEAVADFEHSRTWTPKAWRGAGAMEASARAIYEQTIAEVAAHDGEWGGASFNPHTGRFIKGGEDAGFAVGLIPGTAIEVPFEEFTAGHIEAVVRAYQDAYQHPNTIVGTWVEDGKVYIDPSEIVPTLDDALIRGAARQQLSIFDVAGDNVVGGILKDRPDVAAQFITRHRSLSARSKELRDIAQRSGLTDSDVSLVLDLLMRQAVRAQDLGLVKHPDDFFHKYVSKFEFAKKGSQRKGTLEQRTKSRPRVATSVTAAPDGGIQFTFEAEGKAGHLDVIVDPATREAYVDVIVTHPSHRRQGVADALMDEAYERLGDENTFKFSPLSEDGQAWLNSYLDRRAHVAVDRGALVTMADEFSEISGKVIPPDDVAAAFNAFAEAEADRLRAGGVVAAQVEFGVAPLAQRTDVEAFDTLDIPGDLSPLLQSFHDKVLGEFVPLDDGTRGVIRIFEDGNLATLVHENGHLLRRILPDAEMRAVEGAYGIKGRKWDVAKEEAFANDLLSFMQTSKAPDGLGSTFARVREALSDIWRMVSGTFHRRRVHPELATIFTDWLDPAVRPMDEGIPGLAPIPGEAGTLNQRAARPPKLPEPPARGSDYYAAGRKGQKALAHLEQLAARKRQLAASQAAVQGRIDAVRTVLADNKLPSQLERDALTAEAARLNEKVQTQLGTPSVARTPARWQPLWQAVTRLGKEAETNPEMGVIFDDLPATLHEIQNLALSAGFDPAHVRDFSSVQVRRLVFGNMRLGLGRKDLLHEVEAGTRKKRTGTLSRAGAVDRSVESFLAATIEATNEKRTNAVVSWVEQNVSRTIPAGSPIPAGWQLWDPVRTYLLTGTELSEDGMRAVTTSAKQSQIIPETVVRTLDRFSKDYDHWAWRSIRKVTSPWRTLVLTLSPGWYTRNVVGNIILATAEGTGLKDWQAAWASYKSKDEIGHFADLPFVTSDTLAQEALASVDDSLIPRQGIGEAVAEGGKVRGTAQFASRKMLRVNEVVDEFARAAVYHKGLRTNLTPEQAWKRAKEALVDYNALSPFERTAVRAVIPFYAWQKGILKVTLNQAIDHPARTAALTLLGRMQDEYIADRFGVDPEDVPDYYKHLSGSRNLRSFNPFSDPSEIVTVEGITRSMNPFIELAVRKGLGAPEFYTEDQRLGMFGSVQQDVDVPSALADMVTRSPGGRIIGQPDPAGALGLAPVDDATLRSRFLRARRQIRDIPNPETAAAGNSGGSFLPPRLR